MSTDAAICGLTKIPLPTRLIENPPGLVSLWDVYQIYAHKLVTLLDELRDLEIKLGGSGPQNPGVSDQKATSERFLKSLIEIRDMCSVLQLSSSEKQVRHISETIGNKITPGPVVSPMLVELRRRIREDLEDHVYFCVPESEAHRSFIRNNSGLLQFKVAEELMDPVIVGRFKAASEDIEATYRCLAFDCYTASMFHLMRVVEVAVIELAAIAGLKDPTPSWGSVLQFIEKLVLRTKHEDVDPLVRPHRKLLEAVLPQMQAIQRAWRNKFSHVGTKIVPSGSGISGPIAIEILTAVVAFMRQLATDYPIVV